MSVENLQSLWEAFEAEKKTSLFEKPRIIKVLPLFHESRSKRSYAKVLIKVWHYLMIGKIIPGKFPRKNEIICINKATRMKQMFFQI